MSSAPSSTPCRQGSTYAGALATDLTEDVLHEACLPLGWVDTESCAVTEVWSGLRFVLRKENRPGD